jgi:hypothetical protein
MAIFLAIVAATVLFCVACWVLATVFNWLTPRTPTYRDVESWGWGKHGQDWEYDRNNRPRRINRWSQDHER